MINGDSAPLSEFLPDSQVPNKNGILSATKRADNALTVQFENPDSLAKFGKEVTAKFGTKIAISAIPPYQPSMKIVGFNDVSTPMTEKLTEICIQNQIDPAHLQLIREYSVNASRRTYRNAIVSCSIDVLTKAVRTGVLFQNRSYRCFEQIRTTQCFKCYAFGHTAAKCINKVACRNCAGEHTTATCTDTSGKFQCINCKSDGKPYDHKVTSESCPRRIERINGIIDFLDAKIKAGN